MTLLLARRLILACGNTLRSDDGIGPWLAQWAEEKFLDDPNIRVITRQQWTPDLAEDISQADSILFIDCSIESAPGSVRLIDVEPSAPTQGLATHHQGAPELLALTRDLYNSHPRAVSLLTIGAGSTELGETFSEPVLDAIPEACRLLEQTILNRLQDQSYLK
ncbi:MAG: hydrogenase maturation protease [Terracidiphilus sp.]|jgi:hydrogenase maturation protease